MFTRDQIEEIKKKLVAFGTKDTQLLDAHKLDGNEIVAIVQDGENRKIPLSSIIGLLSDISVTPNDDFINVSKDTTGFLTLSTAVSKVDINNRKLGQVITFKDSANSWAVRQFIGSSLDNWHDISLWKSISGIDELKSQVESNAEDISVLSGEIDRHDASILNLSTDVSKLKDKDIETSSSLSGLTTRVDTLKSQADTNTNNISSLNTEVSTLQSKVDVNTTSISKNKVAIEKNTSDIKNVSDTVDAQAAKLNDVDTTLENALFKNKGYFTTLEKLNEAIPNPTIGSKAYVGTSEPYAIYIVENGVWVDSGYTGGDEIVAKITTDRIENGAVTSEKIATSAFDSTLSVSGKIAPADVVGRKFDDLGEEIKSNKSIPINAGGYFISYTIGAIPTFVENGGYRYAQYECFGGQVFKIKGVGANAARLWYTLNADGKIVRNAANGESSLQEVTIESGEVIIGYNSGTTTDYIFELITSVPLIARDIIKDYNEKIQIQEDRITERYGRIIENNEFIYAIVDSEGKLLFGLREDGSVYLCSIDDLSKKKFDEIKIVTSEKVGLMSPTMLQDLLNNTANLQEIDTHTIESDEWARFITDAEGRILYGVRKDGSFYMKGVPSDIQDAINVVQDEINKGNTLVLPQSEYVNDIMTQDTDIVLPVLSKEQSLCEIKNIEGSTIEEQFLSAINRYQNGESICICLEEDVILSNTCSINCTFDSDLTIEGNGHKIYVAGEQFDKQGIKYGLGYSEFLSPSVNCAYVSDTGDILTLNRTKFYYAKSRITDENGNYLSEEEDAAGGIRRFKLPDELSNLNIVETDYVFVNFSCWFVSRTCRVIKTEYRAAEGDAEEGNYLFFQFESGSYPSDYDYSYAKTFCSFFLINYGNNYEGISVKENKIFFPSRYKYVRYCNEDTFSIDVTGRVLISNVSFVGGNRNIIGNGNSTIIIENCSFKNSFGTQTITGSETTDLYISKCCFNNLWGGAVSSLGKLYVCDCNFKNTSLNRTNNFGIQGSGHYYIARNYIEDYGYGAIRLGLISMSDYKESYGIVECNTIKQSREYLYEAKHKTIMDSGAIYVATNNNPYCVLRYNKVINFDGRKDNRGFFLDDGAYNVYVLGNILENIVNARSIEGRFATGRPTAGLTDNINKVFVYNVCDQGINISGRPNVEGGNGCYLGYNLFTDKCYLSHVISNVMGQEEQIRSKLVSIENGIVKLPLDILNIWKLS